MTTHTNQIQAQLLENWPPRSTNNHLLSASAAEQAARRDTLLEDWPDRKSGSTFASFDSKVDGDEKASAAEHTRTVRISETSQLYLYEGQPKSLLRSLSYTSKDRNRFRKDALLAGRRIKMLVVGVQTSSSNKSIRYLLHHDIVSRDELVGIEHYCLDSPMNVQRRRERHAAAVLLKQEEQKRQKVQDEDAALSLGKFAQSSSSKCAQRAQIRAAIAA